MNIQIETKFNIGDTVYFVHKSIIQKALITCINISYSAIGVFNPPYDHNNGECMTIDRVDNSISYSIYGGAKTHSYMSESSLFSSKEEILEHLSQNINELNNN